MTDAEPFPGAPADAPVRPRSLHRRGGPERSWTPVGTIDSGVLAHVDEAGSVQLAGATWSLDWWIGAEDRWHHPSREASVRQHPLGDAPVLETALRAPGGDVVARAYGARAEAGPWRGPAVVVEVENRTAVPVALAFVIRPLALDGDGSLRDVRSAGAVVDVDGAPTLLLGRVPARTVVGALDDVWPRLQAGDDTPGDVALRREAGDVEAAFVVPLTHTATARVLLPVTVDDERGTPSPASPWTAPEAEAVAKGWSVHRGDALRIATPEPDWDAALVWADAMLRLAGPDEVGACLDRRRTPPAGPAAAVRTAEVAEAMARLGADAELAVIARGLAGAQRLGGEVRLGDRSDGTVALVHAVAGALRGLDPDAPLTEELVAPAAVAIRRLAKGRGLGDDPTVLAAAVRGLRALAPVLVRVGQPEVADDARTAADRLTTAAPLEVSPISTGLISTGPTSTGSALDDARRARALVLARGGPDHGAAALAAVRRCWSGAEQRGRGDGAVGSLGFDVAELAARTAAMLDVLVADGPEGPALLAAFDPAWAGQPVEAHGMVTPWGDTSFALRWHGARPALLWEVGHRPDAEDDAVVVTAPGLDPGWRGEGREGEALLAAPPGAAPARPEPAPPGPGIAAAGSGADVELPGEGDSFG